MFNLLRRVRHVLQSRRLDRELREELEFHEAMKRAELERDGVLPGEAGVRARQAMGNVSLSREDARAIWIWTPGEQLVQDARYGARALARRPAFTAAAVAILALGIGITTAMFTILDTLILRPVPFQAPEELATVAMMNARGGRTDVAPSVLRAWRESPAFAGAEGAVADTVLVEVDGSVVMRGVAHVTPGLFDLLGGVRPVHGRLFDSSEGREGTHDRVLLSEDLWRSLYRADPALVGRRVTIDGDSVVVVGILPSDFRFPHWNTVIWRPLDFQAPPRARARLRPVAYVRFSHEMPRDDALRVAADAARGADAASAALSARATPLGGLVLDTYYQRAVPLLSGGVVLVFLVLCANLSSLLLARLTARRREFSMRSALGASRARLLRQAFLEGAILGALGVVAGIGLASMLVSLARAFLPEAFLLHTLNPLSIDVRALVVASASGVLATFGAGLLPAWLGTRVDAGQSLRVAGRGGTGRRGAQVVTRGLLVLEMALACTLLVGATLLVRSFVNLSQTDRGLDTTGVVIGTMTLPESTFADRAARDAVARLIEEKVRELPAVRQVAWSYGVPPHGGAIAFGEWISDAPGAPRVTLDVDYYHVGPEFFGLYGLPLLRGRAFVPTDSTDTVIVGERLAQALWPNLDPVGRVFRHGDSAPLQVIGVAREIHHPSLDQRVDRPEFYRPFGGVASYPTMSVRCEGRCPDAALIHQRIAAAHPAVSNIDVRLLDSVYFEQLARPRAAAALGFAFAAIAVLAAAGGLFSVLSYAVASRRREFGIRTALGASPAQIRRIVLGDGLAVAVAGLSLGSVAAWAVARTLASLQYGVTAHDPLSWTLVLGVIGLTTLAAAWRPAHEATQVDPVLLLREE